MKSGLLSSRFFIPIIYVIHFQTIGMSLSLKCTDASVKSINFTFLLQDFRFCFCEFMISLFFKNQSRSFFQITEPGESFVFSFNLVMSASFSPRTAWCAKEIPSLSESVS